MEWKANSLNGASISLAKKIGFKMEGVLRWCMVLDEGKRGNGRELREGDSRALCEGRDTWLSSLCWDDWVYGGADRLAV